LRAQRDVDFAANARSLGCHAEAVSGVAELDAALDRARGASSTYVIVIPTDPDRETQAGGAWWDVPSWTDAEGRGNGA
jgi:3D-(3,5/4)-trihydroxycyclohexane-1,2-dione acylhydrolase (decyclizing)